MKVALLGDSDSTKVFFLRNNNHLLNVFGCLNVPHIVRFICCYFVDDGRQKKNSGAQWEPDGDSGELQHQWRRNRPFRNSVSPNDPLVLFVRPVSSRLNSLCCALRQPHISLSVSGGGKRIEFPTVGDPSNFPERTAGEYRFHSWAEGGGSCPHVSGDTFRADGLIRGLMSWR